jgi:hypothetical protein
MQLDPTGTAELHGALRQESEALVHDIPYERNTALLIAVRDAQRSAVKAGLQGRSHEGEPPTVTIEIFQISVAP